MEQETVKLVYLDEETYFRNPNVPLTSRDASIAEAVQYARSEEGLSTSYMAFDCATQEIAHRASMACYMAGAEEPPPVVEDIDEASQKVVFCVVLWDELGK